MSAAPDAAFDPAHASPETAADAANLADAIMRMLNEHAKASGPMFDGLAMALALGLACGDYLAFVAINHGDDDAAMMRAAIADATARCFARAVARHRVGTIQ